MRKDPLINIAIRAARAAGNTIMRAVDRLEPAQVSEKRPNDYVTEVDQQVEREIIGIIQKAYPHHSILGEESGEITGKEEYLWIIDPIDGTRNFIHGVPHFAVSIGISYRGKIEHGVIYDPVRQELFIATRGKGAFLNDRRIRVSSRSKLEECLLGTGFPFHRNDECVEAYVKAFQIILPVCGDVRRAGAATLDLAYVACGRLDGFWEIGLKPWDLAAGTLLIKEAGGLLSDFAGSEDYLNSGSIIAGNPKVLKFLVKTLSPLFGKL